MRRIVSIFLTLTFMLYLGGIQLLYWIRIDTARHNATVFIQEHYGEQGASQQLVFTDSQYNSLQWSEKNKEFVFQGQRYDIANITHNPKGVKIDCYKDNEETDIANDFHYFTERLFNTHQNSGTNENDVISKITKEYLPFATIVSQHDFPIEKSFIIEENYPIIVSPVSNIWHPPTIC